MSAATQAHSATLRAALDLASQGIPVFPCWNQPGDKSDKAPLIQRGFYGASCDPAVIRTWFERWPNARVGVPTGETSGIDAVDTDPRNGCGAWFEDNGNRIPGTRVNTTSGGGKHILFRHATGVACSNDARIHAGVDIKGDGGYIIWHPAGGCDVWLDWPLSDLPDWPEWLLQQARRGKATTNAGDDVPLSVRCPPSADAVVELLNRLPNPPDAFRESYTDVMLAAVGCISALDEADLLGDEDEQRIADAAIAWSERWEGRSRDDITDERLKWESDWSQRDEKKKGGWQTLERQAGKLIPDYALERAREEFAEADAKQRAALLNALDIHTWANLEIPPKTRFLGDLLATASRVFLIGGTGLGKTHLAYGAAVGIATGTGFLHWKCDRAGRVLVIDGEMSKRLIKGRLAAAVQRSDEAIPPGNLVLYSLDRSEEFAAVFPGLGYFEPLNTKGGQRFAMQLISLIKPDVVIADNVMSLIAGDQKDELPWSDTLPLVGWITRQGIAQVWLDHTGHDRTRQYGSSTKAWRFDAVGIMTAIEEADQKPGELAFKLSFRAPHGKARERDADNWSDFACRSFALAGDKWEAKLIGADDPHKAAPITVRPAAAKWYEALVEALRGSTTPGSVCKAEWFAAGVRKGLTEAVGDNDHWSVRDRKDQPLRAAKQALVTANWVAVDGDTIRDLRDGGTLHGLA